MSEPPESLELGYESAVVEPMGRRPAWVWAIIVIYLLLMSVILLLPLWVRLVAPGEQGLFTAASVAACVVTICGLGLVFTPVRLGRRRRMTRANIWLPILSAGFMLGLLLAGAGYALGELFHREDPWMLGATIGGVAVWVIWSLVFWFITGNRDPNSVAARLHRWMLAGSVAELLVAVPAHVIVRRRTECCAGFATGSAIVIGIVVMFIAFGPSVVFLYYRRWKKITGN